MTVLLQETLLIVLILSGVPLIAASVVGFVASLLQAVTQVQEQSISYVLKLLAVVGVAVAGARWGSRMLTDFSARIFEGTGMVLL